MNKVLSIFLLAGLCALAHGEFIAFDNEGNMHGVDSVLRRATMRANLGFSVNASAVASDGTIYVAYDINKLARVNPGNGALTQVANLGFDCRALSFVGSTLYAIQEIPNGNDRLRTINVGTGASTVVGTCNHQGLQAMATSANGTLYAWDVTQAGLVTVNPATGQTSDVHPNQGPEGSIQGMDIDRYGVMLGIVRGRLYRIDLASGFAKFVGRLADNDYRALSISRNTGRMMAVDANNRLWSIDLSTGRGVQVGAAAVANKNLCAMPDGRLWAEFLNRANHIDPGSGARTALGAVITGMGSCASAFGTLYAISGTGNQNLFSIDTITGATTLIGSTGRSGTITSLTADEAGTLHAWDTALGLMRVNRLTGAATDASTVGAAPEVTSIEFAPDGNLYGAGTALHRLLKSNGTILETIGSGNYPVLHAMASVPMQGRVLGIDNAGSTYEVDLRTPGSSLLANFPGELRGLVQWPEGPVSTISTTPSPDQVLEVDRLTGVVNPAFLFQTPNTASWVGSAISDGSMVLVGLDTSQDHHFARLEYPSGLLRSDRTVALGSTFIAFAATRDGSMFGYTPQDGLIQVGPDAPGFYPVDATPPGTNHLALAFLPDGRCYSASGPSLFSLDPLNGDLVFLGNHGYNSRGMTWIGPVVSGSGTLQGWVGPDYNLFYEIEVRHPNTLEVVESHLVHPRNGVISFASTLFGRYQIAVKPRHGLRRVFPTTLIINGATFAAHTYTNGDIDNDNEVTIGDYALLSTNFGLDSSSPFWNPQADLDGDEEVSIGDYSLMSVSFGETGDD